MSLGSFIKKQFIDILQWNEDGEGVLAWRYPMQDFEIQYGGSLTVRESQAAVFVNEGKIADVFAPGMYKLTTQTLPVLTYLKNWDKLFESPFKSDVYFFSTRLQTGRKWACIPMRFLTRRSSSPGSAARAPSTRATISRSNCAASGCCHGECTRRLEQAVSRHGRQPVLDGE